MTTINGMQAVTFDGDDYFEGPTTVSGLQGSSNRTLTAWFYNPSFASDKTVISWERQGSPNRNMPFTHGTGTTWGALNYWGAAAG
ncbi:MAG: hypothetical protein L7V86_04550 [Verrucomicrobiales bacterium]|nr:hypothetical protein [Verrucomicrobiales bacterium]